MSLHSAKCTLLVVDDEPAVLSVLASLLAKEFDLLAADSAESAIALLRDRSVDLVLTDQKLPGKSGVQLLEWVREHHPKAVRLLMTGLARFEDAVAAINCGQVSRYLFKPWRSDELLQVLRNAARAYQLERENDHLVDALQQLNQELEARVRERTRELEEANHQLQQKNWMLEKLALTDALTGLPNRRAMERLARTELRRCLRRPVPFALGVLDVDYFKEVNSQYLLSGGDQVLIDLGKVLVASVRTTDGVGRVGGEEFEIVAPETDHEGAIVLAERIRTAVEDTDFSYKGQSIRITASLGFAVAPAGIEVEYDSLRHVATLALSQAKSMGRNRCVIRSFEPSEVIGVKAAD